MAIFTGISFPFRLGPTSLPGASTDEDLIKQTIMQLVLTIRGERIMRPEVGSNVYSFVFEQNNTVLADVIRAEVQTVIGRFEPRVILRDVKVQRKESEVLCTIEYVIISTRTLGSTTVALPTP
jgi:phage baseplate assembly protein W